MVANLDFLLESLNESRGEKAKGSKSGRQKYVSKNTSTQYDPKKAKVKVYPSISKALSHSRYGEIFSTDAANRLYVTTKPDWGKKSTKSGNSKVAKGFTPGSSTPGASWDSIKSYAVRTMKKHAGDTSKNHQIKNKANELKLPGIKAPVGQQDNRILKSGPFADMKDRADRKTAYMGKFNSGAAVNKFRQKFNRRKASHASS